MRAFSVVNIHFRCAPTRLRWRLPGGDLALEFLAVVDCQMVLTLERLGHIRRQTSCCGLKVTSSSEGRLSGMVKPGYEISA